MRLEHLLSGDVATLTQGFVLVTVPAFPGDAFRLLAALSVFGGLAQLARALAWHARGHRFDPDILHSGNSEFVIRNS